MSRKIAYGEAPHVQLSDLMDYTKVRTIPVECRTLRYDAGEWPVIFELEKDSALRSLLPPMLRNAMFIYAYVRGGKAVQQLFHGHTRHERNEAIRLNEFSGGFLMIVRQADNKEEPIYLVDASDVRDMLQHARHPSPK